MAIFRNPQGDVLELPDALAAFAADRGYTRVDDDTQPPAAAAPAAPVPPQVGDSESGPTQLPTSPAVQPDPAAGDNDSKGVSNNG